MKYTVIVENIKVPVAHRDEDIIDAAVKQLKKSGLANTVSTLSIRKKSIDARKKNNIILVCSVAGYIDLPHKITDSKIPAGIKIAPVEDDIVTFGTKQMESRPVIVGFGPAGMFCAMELAKYGYDPVVYERGSSIDNRVKAVDAFMNGGSFSPFTNIQFGAGGAGAFSDGKLTTRIGDPLCRKVLESLCELGAPNEILWQAKPHIGTDILQNIVRNADTCIRAYGGDIYYGHCVSGITSKTISVGDEKQSYGALVLAIGHSSRDTYAELGSSEFPLVPKPFSVGVRIEHLREDIDYAMYGSAAGMLPPAEYALSYREGERGVYSFCMCPGGIVVPASSEEGGVVTNGMSYSRRDGVNSNAALAVSVLPDDYGNTVSGAMDFQRKLEVAAYNMGGGNYAAPSQTVGSFLSGNTDSKINSIGRILPTYMNGNIRMCDLSLILPEKVTEMLKCGISKFGKNIKGYDCPDAVLTGVETRTSAPLRIMRGEDRIIASDIGEIYPCGEGAGYAGGIMSAAVDGIRTARAIMRKFAPMK